MKIQSGLLTNGSGSVGGMTAAKNRGGLYLRARAAVTNPQTAGQTLVRTMLAFASTTWRTLTNAQREGWNDWAAVNPVTNVFGDPMLMSGHQAYIALNTPRLQAALGQIDDAPVGFGQPIALIPGAAAPTLIIDDPNVDLVIPVIVNEPEDGHILMYVSKPQSPSTMFFKGPYNLVKAQTFVGGVGAMQASANQVTLPPVAADQVVYYRLRITTETGRLGTAFTGKVTVTEAP